MIPKSKRVSHLLSFLCYNKRTDFKRPMNAVWGGISGNTQISMCLSAGHKTVKNILTRKAFTVSMADVDHLVACDYVGIVSGNSVPDKFERAGS